MSWHEGCLSQLFCLWVQSSIPPRAWGPSEGPQPWWLRLNLGECPKCIQGNKHILPSQRSLWNFSPWEVQVGDTDTGHYVVSLGSLLGRHNGVTSHTPLWGPHCLPFSRLPWTVRVKRSHLCWWNPGVPCSLSWDLAAPLGLAYSTSRIRWSPFKGQPLGKPLTPRPQLPPSWMRSLPHPPRIHYSSYHSHKTSHPNLAA